MIALIRKFWDKEGIRYLFFGGCTTVLSTVVFWLCLKIGIPYLAAQIVSWIAAVLFAFFTNKAWVFRSTDWDAKVLLRELGSFVASRLFTLALGTGVLYACVEWLHLHEMAGKVISQAVEIAANYVLSKLLVFAKGKK